MWNAKKSVLLSLWFTNIFMVLFLALELTAPFAVKEYIAYFGKTPQLQIPLTAFIYSCLLPVGYGLWLLRQLLQAIRREQCFCEENIVRLRRLSWCCFFVAVLTLGFGFQYIPFLLLAPFIAFVGLILRIIKNIFQTSLMLQTENEMTI